MTAQNSSVGYERKGYSRGLILGFTMAETLLLLIFCLLLALGAALKFEMERRQSVEASLSKSLTQVKSLESEVVSAKEDLAAIKDASAIDKPQDWRELVLASSAFKKLEAAGVRREQADQLVQLIDALKKAEVDPVNAEAVKAMIEKAEDYRTLIAALEAANLTKSDITKIPEERQEAREIAERLQDAENANTELRAFKDALAKAGLDVSSPETAAMQAVALLKAKAEGNSTPHEWPPIINLSEAGGYYFKSGKADLAPAFGDKLKTSISEEIADNLDRYNVDVIEVIGHTDEQRVSRSTSNLDDTFIDVIKGRKPISDVEPADNAGLGLARALAVADILKSNPRLKDATILPMSAAQLVLPGDRLTMGQSGNVESRRRIEIRIRRRNDSLQP